MNDYKIPDSNVDFIGLAIHYFYKDFTPEYLAHKFKLPMSEVYRALAYYHENFEAVRASIWARMGKEDKLIAEWVEAGKLITFNTEYDPMLIEIAHLPKSIDVVFTRPTQDRIQGSNRNLYGEKRDYSWQCSLAYPLYDYGTGRYTPFELPDANNNPAYAGASIGYDLAEYSNITFIVFKGYGEHIEGAFRYAYNAYQYFMEWLAKQNSG